MRIEHNLSKPELAKALWEIIVDEGVDGLILENVVDRVDNVEKDVENYLDAIWELDNKVDTVSEEVTFIRYRDLANLKLALTFLFILVLADFIAVLLILFQYKF